MLQFSKLISILSFLIIIYSIYKMGSEQEDIVFYIGIFVTSITVLMLSVGVLIINVISKKGS
ncbi:hypothetical protein [Sulfurimonas sp.]